MTFKKGDKVKIVGNSNSSCNKIGDIGVIKSDKTNGNGSYQVEVPNRFGGNWTRPSDMVLVEDEFEDEWHLNNGKVTIPDDAHKLMDGGSVVAFRKRKVVPLVFGDELTSDTQTYKFIRYSNGNKDKADIFNPKSNAVLQDIYLSVLKRK